MFIKILSFVMIYLFIYLIRVMYIPHVINLICLITRGFIKYYMSSGWNYFDTVPRVDNSNTLLSRSYKYRHHFNSLDKANIKSHNCFSVYILRIKYTAEFSKYRKGDFKIVYLSPT